MNKYLFDPGFGKYIPSFTYTTESIYENIEKLKNHKQKRFYFKRNCSAIIVLMKRTSAFYLGCLLWAVYLKTLPEGEITGNYCYGHEYDEENSLFELLYFIKFTETFPKDMKYYLNQDFSYPERHARILELYKEFAKLNEGFVNTAKNTDIKLPGSIKQPSAEDAEKINSVIQETVIAGDFDKLFGLTDFILR